jgi:hypothetical protein
MKGSNWSIIAGINEILREMNFVNAFIHFHCTAGVRL